jgi:type II secretory pathway component PulM
MGEWKASVSLRIRPALRIELEQLAAREERTLGNIGSLLLEWAAKQLIIAGSTENLRKCKVYLPDGRSYRVPRHK